MASVTEAAVTGAVGVVGSKHAAPVTVFFSVTDLTNRFGNLVALDGLSFEVHRSEILGIAGPNGAGKSTLLNICTGFLAPSAGTIAFGGKRVDGLPPYKICHRGVARTFQIPRVFGSLSVEENVRIGASFGAVRGGQKDVLGHGAVERVLEVTGLVPRRALQAGTVDLLTRKMTMLAAALATDPRIVFMDEPLAGLNAEETRYFAELIARLRERTEIAFVVVEHKIRVLSRISDRLMILHFGKRICLDTPDNVVRDPYVTQVYLGTAFVA